MFPRKKGTCFSTYLHLVISTHLSNYYRKTLKQKARFCNYEYLDDEEIYKLDILMYHNDSLAQKVQDCQQMLHLVYEEFSDEEQLIFGLYLRGYNQKEITSSLHISKYHIQYMLDKFKKKCLEISENKAFD